MMVVCALTAVIISVSTYAWFIGMRTVNVSSFDIEVAGTDSLLLSLDGSSWDTTVSITPATLNTVYTGNTNNFGGRGLLPMSSIGDMDANASRMKLYEKASLTASPGGYRLMASRVNNYNFGTPGNRATLDPERDGYVVFDLFVHNFSGTQYLTNLEPKDEEAIYLTTNSKVSVALDGGVDGAGIENSVRVAFAQIGRVAGTMTNVSTITGITCEPDADGKPSVIGDVTGICRTAQIWEPNDKLHVANAISWYNTSCVARKALPDGAYVTDKNSFAGSCGTITNGTAYPTYAVGTAIASGDEVDVYDGFEYNTYTSTAELVKYPFFTDTMKDKRSTERPLFMTFAPNSITKVRVYIYIEGQDVDNYDFAQIGKSISIKFGFTKERYTEDDIDYTGPETNEGDGPSSVTDTTKPIITLAGTDPMTVTLGQTYNEPGVTSVSDNRDTTLTISDVVITGTVNVNVADSYTIVYTLTDASGNTATKTRTVIVQ
jgi:hypothetical protein